MEAFVQAHLRSLEQVTAELRSHVDGLGEPVARLTETGGELLRLGSFTEASTLALRHLAVADQVRQFVVGLRGVTGSTAEVTQTVVDGYEQFDDGAAASYGRLAI